MSPEGISQQREALASIRDVKEMILADARVRFSTRGLIKPHTTYDVITSNYDGAYQALLIYFTNDKDTWKWKTLCDSPLCKDTSTAMKMLWDAVQTGLGDLEVKTSPASPTIEPLSDYTPLTPVVLVDDE